LKLGDFLNSLLKVIAKSQLGFFLFLGGDSATAAGFLILLLVEVSLARSRPASVRENFSRLATSVSSGSGAVRESPDVEQGCGDSVRLISVLR
jgi:hypothetical protein